MQSDTPSIDENLLKQLPPVLRAVVKALGFCRAKKFLEEYGGTPIRIRGAIGLSPKEIDNLEKELKLHIIGTGVIFLPKADKLLTKIRNDQIRLNRKNMTLSELARQNQLTTRHVLNICRFNKITDKNSQATLFNDNKDLLK